MLSLCEIGILSGERSLIHAPFQVETTLAISENWTRRSIPNLTKHRLHVCPRPEIWFNVPLSPGGGGRGHQPSPGATMAVLSGSRLLSVNPQTCNYLAKLSCKNFPLQRILQGSAQCADYSQDWARKWSGTGQRQERRGTLNYKYFKIISAGI